jgi:hypothetical protein
MYAVVLYNAYQLKKYFTKCISAGILVYNIKAGGNDTCTVNDNVQPEVNFCKKLNNVFHIHAVHLDFIKVNLFTNECASECLKIILKIYIKIAQDMFWCSHTIFRERIIRACF